MNRKISKTKFLAFIFSSFFLFSFLSLISFLSSPSLAFAKVAKFVSAAASSNSLTSGLAGYWTFDGANLINNVADSSGNNNKGYLMSFGATSTAVVQGKLGQGLKFNGTSNWINTTNDLFTGSAFTVSFWINPASYSGTYVQGAVSNQGGTYGTIFGTTQSYNGATNTFSAGIGTGANTNAICTVQQSNYATGVWYHYVAVYDGTQATDATKLKIYINSVSKTTACDSSVPSSATDNALPVAIGKFQVDTTSNPYFNGSLDDVRVYTRALSATEVGALYRMGQAKFESSATLATAGGVRNSLDSGLVGYWTFDGANLINNVADVSGNGNNGLLQPTNATSSMIVPGKLGQAFNFNGVNNYITENPNSSMDNLQNVTISFWTKPMLFCTSCTHVFFVKANKYTIQVQTPSLVFYSKSGVTGAWYVPTSPPLRIWTHVVITQSGINTPSIYYNGTAQTVNITTAGSGSPSNEGNTLMYIGSTDGSTNFYKGSLDDVRIYNRALSASEILQLYNFGTAKFKTYPTNGLVLDYSMDRISGTKVIDQSGQNNNGTITGGVTFSKGFDGSALTFDGLSGYINVPKKPIFNTTADLTISAWVKPSITAVSDDTVIMKGTAANATVGYRIAVNAVTGAVVFQLGNGTASIQQVTGNTSITTNTWHHIVGTVNGTAMTAYLDGKSDGTAVFSGTRQVADYNVGIGQQMNGDTLYTTNNNYDLTGLIDGIRVYNRALSASEVWQLYSATK